MRSSEINKTASDVTKVLDNRQVMSFTFCSEWCIVYLTMHTGEEYAKSGN